jgi:1,2-phenylacetyl-CoA epoxidase PaaB subunit
MERRARENPNTNRPRAMTSTLRRYRVFRTSKSPNHLCICAARDAKHALKIARQMFTLPRDAHAVPENQSRQLRLL